ncbi:hypothetical protein TREMEDRAFT_66498 [Tremella mesenterica DSM 1558]|uniref:uncharacterized protein n=1 Tax=Tremella mesenterica (strain ATCC 24925 / CBS 8224 / DSM 1558 / NBRC 9311 / NRRL Y-6157 / RJB 2259-6 / UBC 559-6) TaxID=578456 RepID=UPI00032BA382|nr:uncharacterized protein TREMEDRAFT_66498 [Tremella mesenterica DSM 1558]EIW65506.1 hypothetical protein TREMEDRAFT_66498 [Tremella mesenterica DSM 1558]
MAPVPLQLPLPLPLRLFGEALIKSKGNRIARDQARPRTGRLKPWALAVGKQKASSVSILTGPVWNDLDLHVMVIVDRGCWSQEEQGSNGPNGHGRRRRRRRRLRCSD